MKTRNAFKSLLTMVTLVVMAMSPARMWADTGSWTLLGVNYGICAVGNNKSISANAMGSTSSWGSYSITSRNDLGAVGCQGTEYAGTTAKSDEKFISISRYKQTYAVPSYAKLVRTSLFKVCMASARYRHGAGLYIFDTDNEAYTTSLDAMPYQDQSTLAQCVIKATDHDGTHTWSQATRSLTFDNSTSASDAAFEKFAAFMHVTCSYDSPNTLGNEWAGFIEDSYTEAWTYYATITFDANGGEGSMATQAIENTQTLNANTFTRGGYTFTGWNTEADGSGTAYDNAASFAATNTNKGPVTLYAQWTATATITFDANGGEGSMATQTIEHTQTLNANAFTREGYTFTGWNTEADGSGTAYDDAASFAATSTNNGPVTLYAQWENLLDYVIIHNAAELYSFASRINSGEYLNAKLACDIVVNEGTFDADGNSTSATAPSEWVPIATFSGTFDGNGHTISGLYVNKKNEAVGFVGIMEGGTIKNLGIINGYFRQTGPGWAGAVCGGIRDNSTISQCWTDSRVVAESNGGGICGALVGSKDGYPMIKDCYSTGNVTGLWVGGICSFTFPNMGVATNNVEASVVNCYSTASVTPTGKEPAGSICWKNDINCHLTNCYAQGEGNLAVVNKGTIENCESEVSAERFASGEITYKLNGDLEGNSSGKWAWYQKLGTDGDAYPTLLYTGDNIVYAQFGATCIDKSYNNNATATPPTHNYGSAPTWTWSSDGKTASATFLCQYDNTHKLVVDAVVTSAEKTAPTCSDKGTTTYTATVNYGGTYIDTKDVTDIAATGLHAATGTYNDNGFDPCTACGKSLNYQPLGATVDGYYEISNAGLLYSFAAKVNGGATSINGKLTKDIVVNDGTFDTTGNFTATGATSTSTPLEWMPIGIEVNNNSYTIYYTGTFDGQGHTISGLYYNSNEQNYVGLFGNAMNATIQNLGITNTFFNGYNVGAVCSCSIRGVVSQCWSDDKTVIKGKYCGGICCDNANGATIKDCHSAGYVSGMYAGGICCDNFSDYSTKSCIENCYSTATVSASNECGSICGANYSANTIRNCYAPSESNIIGNNKGICTNCESGVSAERFASGEICHKLNGSTSEGTLAWYQSIGTDAYPHLIPSEQKIVYYDAPIKKYSNILLSVAKVANLIHALKENTTISNFPAGDYDGNDTLNLDDLKALIDQILGKD